MESLKKMLHGYSHSARSVQQIKPIGSHRVLLRSSVGGRCLDRVYMDLMDFTSQPDGECSSTKGPLFTHDMALPFKG
jgi:hypothetical protein